MSTEPAAAQRARNKQVQALNCSRVPVVKRTFDLLPVEAREEYAHWLLFLADVDASYSSLVRVPSLDYGYIAEYAGV